MKKYRFFALLLALVMVIGLTACGKKKSDDPNCFEFDDYTLVYKESCIMADENGKDALIMTFDFTNNSDENASCGWVLTTEYMQGGVEMETAYVYAEADSFESIAKEFWSDVAPGVTLEVKNAHVLNGTGEVTVTISEFWSGDSYTLTIDPSTLTRVENEASGDDVDWDYAPEDTSEETTEETPKVASYTDWWEGDWYGWWIMMDATGDYESVNEEWWDTCAVIETYGGSNGYMELWDVDGDRNDLLIGAVDLEFSEAGEGEHGTMTCVSGQFMDDLLDNGEWIVDPGTLAVDNIIVIQGQYEGDEGSYTYKVYLRPWGTVWDDLDESYYPENYYNWYLPLVEDGAAMPDRIG